MVVTKKKKKWKPVPGQKKKNHPNICADECFAHIFVKSLNSFPKHKIQHVLHHIKPSHYSNQFNLTEERVDKTLEERGKFDHVNLVQLLRITIELVQSPIWQDFGDPTFTSVTLKYLMLAFQSKGKSNYTTNFHTWRDSFPSLPLPSPPVNLNWLPSFLIHLGLYGKVVCPKQPAQSRCAFLLP